MIYSSKKNPLLYDICRMCVLKPCSVMSYSTGLATFYSFSLFTTLFMPLEITAVTKSFRAVITPIRTFSGVHPFMLFQLTCLCKFLVTMRAAIWFVTSVNSLMLFQITHSSAFVITF